MASNTITYTEPRGRYGLVIDRREWEREQQEELAKLLRRKRRLLDELHANRRELRQLRDVHEMEGV